MVGILAAEKAPVDPGHARDLVNAITWNAWLIPALFFAAVLVIWFVGKRLPKGGSEVGIVAAGTATVLSYIVLADYIGGGGATFTRAFDWFPFGAERVLQLGMHIDGLTAVMFAVVSTVSLMVQIYSTGYMHGEQRFTWYYTALNLFTGSMLIVVISNNLLQLLIGWELVGVCSYMLIGFWWEEKQNSNAAMKAFITTRTGDVPFIIGIFVLFAAAGTFDIGAITTLAHDGEISSVALTAGAILLLGGAIGKSAQFPLYVWLPDAMAGPTPVSALIHAATMVTAGVFMIARLYPVFEGSVAAINTVAIIGAITMLMAAFLAMVQDDIKRVLAYSTISQLGYMVAALGVGAGNAAIFHLFTHAWFKALLFLGAGSVIHAVHSNNMSDMGGLKRFMPWTYRTFMIGTLALAGIPPLAGFWSKDEIIAEAWHFATHPTEAPGTAAVAFIVYGAAVVTAFLTAFYMSRAFHLTFEGKFRGHGTPHESPRAMVLPLQVLAAFAIVAGFVGLPGVQTGFGAWVAVGGHTHVPDPTFWIMGTSILIAVVGIWLGRKLYLPAPAVDPITKLGWFHKLLMNKYYLDDIYMKGIVLPIRDRVSAAMYWLNQHVFDGAVNGTASMARSTARGLYVVDQRVIDGAVNGAGIGARRGGGLLRYVQSGDVQRYAAMLFGGVAILALLFTRFS